MKEKIHATDMVYAINSRVHFHPPASLWKVVVAAMQGMYSKTKTMRESAVARE